MLRRIFLLFAGLVCALQAFAQVADFSASQTAGCASPLLIVRFTNTSTGTNPGNTYEWDFGNGAPVSTDFSSSSSYSTPGTYTVTLTIKDASGVTRSVKTGQITVYAKPTATFTANTTAGCSPLPVQFSLNASANAPGNLSYKWYFGDGDSSSSPTHIYLTAGTFDVAVVVTNDIGPNCETFVPRTGYITAWPRPRPAITVDRTYLCTQGAPGAIQFTGNASGASGPYTYSWNFEDNTAASTGASVSHSYVNTGIYSVTLTARDSRNCVDSIRYANYIFVEGTIPSFTVADTCLGEYITFRNTTGSGGVASWNFDDGTVDNGNAITYRYKNPGTYHVRMTVTVGNCTKTVTKTVVVYPKSQAVITMSPRVPCPAPQTLTFTANSSVPIADYQWSWYTGGTATGQTVTKTYPTDVEDNLRLIVTTQRGCVDTINMDTLMIRPIVQAFGLIRGVDSLSKITGGCVPYTARFGKVKLLSLFPSASANPVLPDYPATILSYNWDFGDGGTSTAQYPVHTYTSRGNFRGRSIVTTSNGCTDTAFFYISVDTPLPPRYVMTPDSVCFKGKLTLRNTTANIPPGFRFTWAYDREYATIDTQSLVLEVREPNFTNVIIYSNNNGCIDSFSSKYGFRILPPVSQFLDSTFCWPSTSVKFLNNTRAATSQLWLFGDGTTDTAFEPTHTYPGAGIYAPRLVSLNSTTGCRDTGNTGVLTAAIRIGRPGFSLAASDTLACAGRQITLIPVLDSILVNSIYVNAYSWIADNKYVAPNTASGQPWTFTQPGAYDVTLILTYGKSRCLDTFTKPAFIRVAKPIPDFGTDITKGCLPMRIHVQDRTQNPYGSRIINRFWNFGDGDSLVTTADTISHIYDKPGIYDMKIIVTDSLGCSDSLTKPRFIQVNHTVAGLLFTGPDTACTGSPVAFKNAASGYGPLRYFWDFGDGATDTARDPVHAYLSDGDYVLKMIATDTLGCADSVIRPRTIHVTRPKAAFSISSGVSICPPLAVTFRNQSTKANDYNWNFGDGSQDLPSQSPIKTFTSSGIYVIRLIATDLAQCADTAYDTVRVLGYNGAFSFDPPGGCAPLAVRFAPSVANIPLVIWDFNDGKIDTSFNSAPISHTYTRAGAYLPKVIFTDGNSCPNGAVSFALDSVYVDELRANFSWSVPCADTPFTLTDLSSGRYGAPTQFSWSSPQSSAISSGNPGSLKLPAGTQPVRLIATNAAGCRDSITRDVLINPLPLVSAGSDTAVCPGDTARLYASGAQSYAWAVSTATPDAGLNCAACDVALAWINLGGVYTLSGRDENGCYGRDSVEVSRQLKTTSTTGDGGSICYGESFRLNASGATNYQWYPVETIDNPAIANPVATPKTSTTYTVISREGSCEVDTQHIPVVVRARPQFTAGPDKIITLGSAATLEPSGTYKTISWLYNDSTLSCLDCPRPNAHPYYTRTYWATATDEWGCSITDSVTVFVRCNGSEIFIPNTFTPNGDGQNDWFYPQGVGIDKMISFRIYNRWGEMVFENLNAPLNNPASGWDGRYKGEALSPDTYVYLIISRCPSGETIQFKGDVSLVR
jgi:gliding motility-associated-like protein